MKIGLIVPGGVDRSGRVFVIPILLALIERLARRHEVVVVSLDPRTECSEYELLGARVINLGWIKARTRLSWSAIALGKLLSTLHAAGGGFDLLHAFWVFPQGTLTVAAGSLLRVPVVVSIGGGELVWLPTIHYGGLWTLRRRIMMSAVLRSASAVSAPSMGVMRSAKELRPDIQWLPTGVDTTIFQGSIKRTCGPPWRLVHVAGLNEVKNQETLLRAVRQVVNVCPQIVLDCIGVDTLNGRVQALAHDLGIEDIVRFHGVLTVDEIVPFYQKAHLFVQSSLYESMGVAVLEAAAGGVPTVGTNVGIVAEMAPRAAVAVPVSDPGALAKGIVELLENSSRREALALAAQDFAHTYNADWTIAQLDQLYRRLVQRI
ncbi:MAG: glycosyltransferase family 4 protein [Candidatus Sulfotelmatobacter sp.]